VAAARLLDIEPWKSATAVKVNPDSPQRPLRAEALRRGITVFVPTPRLRGGFKKLDPRHIPLDKIEEAASLSRGNRWSEEVALAEIPELDAIVCGSVAVTRDEHPIEGRIYYPFHPRRGETVLIAKQYAYRGAELVVIPQPDGSVACIPAYLRG
jgi:hypothetical protein